VQTPLYIQQVGGGGGGGGGEECETLRLEIVAPPRGGGARVCVCDGDLGRFPLFLFGLFFSRPPCVLLGV